MTSNREEGLGRYDIMLFPKKLQDLGIILEFKQIPQEKGLKNSKKKNKATPEEMLKEALQQIQTRDYASQLRVAGIKRIIGVGIVFQGKEIDVDYIQLGQNSF